MGIVVIVFVSGGLWAAFRYAEKYRQRLIQERFAEFNARVGGE